MKNENMNEEITKVRNMLAKAKEKNPAFKAFIAGKGGGNGRGRGAYRTTILASYNGGQTWVQFYKFWGGNHQERAKIALTTPPTL